MIPFRSTTSSAKDPSWSSMIPAMRSPRDCAEIPFINLTMSPSWNCLQYMSEPYECDIKNAFTWISPLSEADEFDRSDLTVCIMDFEFHSMIKPSSLTTPHDLKQNSGHDLFVTYIDAALLHFSNYEFTYLEKK